MKLTFYGHACFGLEICGKHIVVDPFITGNPKAENIDINSIKADYILITHAHQDHVLDVEMLAEKTGAIIVSNYEIVMHYSKKGLKGAALNHGGVFKIPEFSAKYVNAIHTSSFEDGTYGGQPGGFVINGQRKSVYIAGDTALTTDMKLIPIQYNLTATILPIGGTFTMGVEDAIMASDFVECNKIIGCHYNTFPPIEIDTDVAKNVFKQANKELIILNIGETIAL